MRSVLDCVLEHAERHPERDCVRLFSRQKPAARRTFSEIAAAAERGAGFLAQHNVGRGDPVALIGSHHLDLYPAWLGALWVGAVPTLLAEPSVRIDKGIYWTRLAALLDRLRAKAILIEPGVDVGAGTSGDFQQHTYEELAAGGASAPRPVAAEPDALIALQHSSGTTGLQKGVALTHRMIMSHAAAQNARTQLSADDVTVNWLPLFHDLGLVCSFVAPMIVGSTMVWLSPFEWVSAPELLLDAISQHRATITWLPNFAFAFLAHGVRAPPESFDLSSMRAVYSGGEPVTASAADAFFERYEPAGLRRSAFQTGYGMAEAVGGIAHSGPACPPRFARVDKRIWDEQHRAEPVTDATRGALVQVSCGPLLDGCELRVVDADGTALPPRHAGRLLLRTPYLFSGYYKRDDLNRALFDAEGFFDTGDVGYLDEEGHVFVTGRVKELIKSGGRNVYPQDVEDIVNTVAGVHPGRAVCFGVPVPERETEGIVVLAESDLAEDDWKALAMRIRVAVVTDADLVVVDTRIVPRSSLRKSTAGKLARAGNREWYLAARFGPLPPAIAAGADTRASPP